MSPVLRRPASAPHSRPVKPGATAHGLGEGTTATGKRTRAPRATGPDEARRTNAGPRGTPEMHATCHNHVTGRGAKQQRPPGAANPDSAHHNHTTTAHEEVASNTQPGGECPPKRTHAARGAPGGCGEAQRQKPGWGRGTAAKSRRGHGAPERLDPPDRGIRGGPSSNQGQEAEDAPDWIVRGKT